MVCCIPSICPFLTQLLEYFVVFFPFLTSINLSSTLPTDSNAFQFPPLIFLPKHTQPAEQGGEQRPLLIGMVMEIVRLARATPAGQRGCPGAPSCLQTPTCPLSQLGWPDLESNPRRAGEGSYFIFRERQTGWALIDLEKETLAKSNTCRGLKQQDVHDVMPGFTLASPFKDTLGDKMKRYEHRTKKICREHWLNLF